MRLPPRMAVAGLAALLLMTPAAAQQSPNGSVAGVVQRADKSEPLSGIPVSLSPVGPSRRLYRRAGEVSVLKHSSG
jgi:hypothetical protein